jgi:hypothetical protein
MDSSSCDSTIMKDVFHESYTPTITETIIVSVVPLGALLRGAKGGCGGGEGLRGGLGGVVRVSLILDGVLGQSIDLY